MDFNFTTADPSYHSGAFLELLEQGDEYHVYGHVTDEDFRSALAEWWEEESDYDGTEPPEYVRPVRRCWASWRPIEEDDADVGHEDVTHILELHGEAGPDRFPVTVARDADAERNAQQARHLRHQGESEVIERWPEAVIWRSSATPDRWSVSFRLPGLIYAVRMDSSDTRSVFVSHADRKTWMQRYHGGASTE